MVLRRVLLRLVVALGLLAVVCLVLWTSVLRIYRVDSGSMEPFLFGSEESGEAVLVLFDRSVPDRFEPVILRMPEGAVVKRAVGLPGESVKVRYGDVFIDGNKLGADVARPPFPVVFDQEHHAVEDHFILGATESTPWRNESAPAAGGPLGKENGIGGSTWELDALDIDP
ncbi:MAG: S26 family signal peptidase, partial [Planctomycetota bacterium]